MIMLIGRYIGWTLLFLGIGLLGLDVITYFESQAYKPIRVGRIWFEIDSNSLQLLQPAIERHVDPAVWTFLVQPFLELPAFIVSLVAGIVLAFLFRKRPDRKEIVVS